MKCQDTLMRRKTKIKFVGTLIWKNGASNVSTAIDCVSMHCFTVFDYYILEEIILVMSDVIQEIYRIILVY